MHDYALPYMRLLFISSVQDSTSTSAEYRTRSYGIVHFGMGHAKIWRDDLTNMKCQRLCDGVPFSDRRKGMSFSLMSWAVEVVI